MGKSKKNTAATSTTTGKGKVAKRHRRANKDALAAKDRLNKRVLRRMTQAAGYVGMGDKSEMEQLLRQRIKDYVTALMQHALLYADGERKSTVDEAHVVRAANSLGIHYLSGGKEASMYARRKKAAAAPTTAATADAAPASSSEEAAS